jgi:hypothetical protein
MSTGGGPAWRSDYTGCSRRSVFHPGAWRVAAEHGNPDLRAALRIAVFTGADEVPARDSGEPPTAGTPPLSGTRWAGRERRTPHKIPDRADFQAAPAFGKTGLLYSQTNLMRSRPESEPRGKAAAADQRSSRIV